MLLETKALEVGEIESYHFSDINDGSYNNNNDDLIPSNLEYNVSQVVEYYDNMYEQFTEFAFSRLTDENLEFKVSSFTENFDYFNQEIEKSLEKMKYVLSQSAMTLSDYYEDFFVNASTDNNANIDYKTKCEYELVKDEGAEWLKVV